MARKDNNKRDLPFMFGYVRYNGMRPEVTTIDRSGIMKHLPTNVPEDVVEKKIDPQKPTYRQV